MLVLFIIYTFKRIFKRANTFGSLKSYVSKIKYLLPLLLISMSSLNEELPVTELLSFTVINKNATIGFINIEKQTQNETTTYTINSDISAKVLFKFNAVAKETSIYKRDTLVFSSVYRKLNNKEKRNQSLLFNNGTYTLKNKNKVEPLNIDFITRNLVTLYFQEPVGVTSVFCDNQNEMVQVKSLGNGMYKVQFSKGKYNIFHYKDGKCVKIEAFNPMFEVTLIPVLS
ncbi:MAG TPA: DUF6134 family protein [Flavobacteriaceae bacterium]